MNDKNDTELATEASEGVFNWKVGLVIGAMLVLPALLKLFVFG